ncbi:hypothetical protein B0H12DRAFT_1151481 [Mycena haematopus]|nr:hypothetical protein B0H12DRAFT_1151481 [Mycena haematopus]
MLRAPKNGQSRQQAKYPKKALVSAFQDHIKLLATYIFRAERALYGTTDSRRLVRQHHHSDDEDLVSLRVARPHFDYGSFVYNTY